jgi:transposase
MSARRGKEYDRKVVSLVKSQMTLRKKQRGGHKKTVDEIKDQIGIRSRTTIYNLVKRDTTPEGRLERRMKKGARRLLTLEQEKIVCGYLVTRAVVHKNTSSAVLRIFIREHFGK